MMATEAYCINTQHTIQNKIAYENINTTERVLDFTIKRNLRRNPPYHVYLFRQLSKQPTKLITSSFFSADVNIWVSSSYSKSITLNN